MSMNTQEIGKEQQPLAENQKLCMCMFEGTPHGGLAVDCTVAMRDALKWRSKTCRELESRKCVYT
jgi:hypothetical protein